MYNLSDLQNAFQELSNINQLGPETGQKNVFRGIQDSQDVVLKIMKPNQEALSSMQVEVEAVQKLNSEFIPTIFDFGTRNIAGDNYYYIIEEFIPGQNLRNVISSNGSKSLDYVCNYFDQLLEACVEFEERNLVHRDIKPENLIVDKSSKFWVIDFGIVRHLDNPSRTATNRRFGRFTLGYGAPEQIRNEKPKINSRCDLYSIGIVAYELLDGQNPYIQPNPMNTLRKVQAEDLPPLSIKNDSENKIWGFISTLTSRFPSRRPQSAKQALDWYRDIVSEMGV